MRSCKHLVVVLVALCLFTMTHIDTFAAPVQPSPVESEQISYVWAGYIWDWNNGGFIHIHLTPNEQAYIIQGGTIALAAIAAQACSLTGPLVWGCVAGVAVAGYFLVKQVEAYNGSCDELILYVTPWNGYVYNSYCWIDVPSGGGERGFD